MPQRVYFDQANLDAMNNIAILVRDLKYNATASLLPWASLKPYEMPVVYFEPGSSKVPFSTADMPVGSGVSVSVGGSIDVYPPILIDQVRTDRLQLFLKEYDIRVPFLDKFKDGFIKIKNAKVAPCDEVEGLYKIYYRSVINEITFTTKDTFKSEFDGFKNGIMSNFGVDTLILIDIGLWGFHRKSYFGFATTKGNFVMEVNFRIIRLIDGVDLFDEYFSVDFTDPYLKKKSSNLEEFLKDDKPIIFQTLQELVETEVSRILEVLSPS